MSFIYSDNREPRSGAIAPYDTWKACDRYVEHYGNLLILQAIVNAPKGPGERRQAQKEIGLCERKLHFWEGHPNFVAAEVQTRCEQLRREWAKAR